MGLLEIHSNDVLRMPIHAIWESITYQQPLRPAPSADRPAWCSFWRLLRAETFKDDNQNQHQMKTPIMNTPYILKRNCNICNWCGSLIHKYTIEHEYRALVLFILENWTFSIQQGLESKVSIEINLTSLIKLTFPDEKVQILCLKHTP